MSETLKGEAMKASSLDQFLIILREHEIKTYSRFVCTISDKAFTEEKFTPTKDLRIRWKENDPYFYIGKRVYSCHQGKDGNLYKKKRYAEKRDSMAFMDADFTKRKKTVPTKKLGCPAVISVTRVLALPRFKIQNGSKLEKFEMIREITKTIEKGEELGGENEYSFILPSEESHQNHTVGSNAAVTENMDPKVRSKIKELVLQGVRNISVISATIEQFVANELGETDKSRRRFYPTRSRIRTVVNSIKKRIMSSEANVENAVHSINSCAEKSDLSRYYFPPCTVKPSSDMIVQCNSIIKSLLSVMCQLDENYLIKLKNDLQNIYLDATLNITTGKNTLPIEERSLLSKGKFEKPSKPTPLNRNIEKKVKNIDHAANAKENEILYLYTTSQENNTTSSPQYCINNTDRLIDLPEIPIKKPTPLNRKIQKEVNHIAHAADAKKNEILYLYTASQENNTSSTPLYLINNTDRLIDLPKIPIKKPTPLNRKIRKEVKHIAPAADAKKNEILFLYTTPHENNTSSTPLYIINNTDRLIVLPEIPIKEESIQNFAHTIEVLTSKSLSPQKKKLKTIKET